MQSNKKNIVLVIPRRSAFYLPVTQALGGLGYAVSHFDHRIPDITTQILGTIQNTLSKSSKLRTITNSWINQKLLHSVKTKKPDYVLVIKGENLYPETIAEINKLGIQTINWYPDNIGLWDSLIITAPLYTHYFSVCLFLTQKLNKMSRKTHYLPVAGWADEKLKRTEKVYDVVFAGHVTKKRIEYFKELFPFDFHLWGYPQWKQTALAAHYQGQLTFDEVTEVYRKSKIVLNVATGNEDDPISIANLRNFEATGVGTFVLSSHNKATVQLFKPNKEMVFFETKEEMLKKLRYYLSHERIREGIAHAGWQKTKKVHTYTSRMKELFLTVEKS